MNQAKKFKILKLRSRRGFCLEIFHNVAVVCHELLTLIDLFYSQKIVTVGPRLMFADYRHTSGTIGNQAGSLGGEMKIR